MPRLGEEAPAQAATPRPPVLRAQTALRGVCPVETPVPPPLILQPGALNPKENRPWLPSSGKRGVRIYLPGWVGSEHLGILYSRVWRRRKNIFFRRHVTVTSLPRSGVRKRGSCWRGVRWSESCLSTRPSWVLPPTPAPLLPVWRPAHGTRPAAAGPGEDRRMYP